MSPFQYLYTQIRYILTIFLILNGLYDCNICSYTLNIYIARRTWHRAKEWKRIVIWFLPKHDISELHSFGLWKKILNNSYDQPIFKKKGSYVFKIVVLIIMYKIKHSHSWFYQCFFHLINACLPSTLLCQWRPHGLFIGWLIRTTCARMDDLGEKLTCHVPLTCLD